MTKYKIKRPMANTEYVEAVSIFLKDKEFTKDEYIEVLKKTMKQEMPNPTHSQLEDTWHTSFTIGFIEEIK